MDRHNKPWSDEELKIAVEAYFYLLYLQQSGVDYPSKDFESSLASGLLRGRNDASVRYRMRNISSVFRERGWPVVISYSPAQQVGTKIRSKIESIISKLPGVPPFVFPGGGNDMAEWEWKSGDHIFWSNSAPSQHKRPADRNSTEAISRLHDALEDVSIGQEHLTHAGIGHNNPPEPIEETADLRDELLAVRLEIKELQEKIKEQTVAASDLKKGKKLTFELGLKIALWLGSRFTKFTDAAITTTGAALGAKMSGLMPHIAEALDAVINLLRHMG